MEIPWKDKWVQLNTDGVVKMGTGNATFGGVLRNHEGKWILSFNRCLRKCLVFNAELWEIYIDLFIL